MTNRPVLFYLMLIAAMITWGISWASGKVLASQTSPEILLFWRFLFTSLSLIPVVYFFEKNWKIQRTAVKYVVSGGLLMCLYNYLFFQGLRNGLAGAGGVLVTTMNPVFTFLITSLISRYKPHKKEIAGLIIGPIGGLIMIHVWRLSYGELAASGNLFLMGASVTWTFMTLVSQHSGKSLSVIKFSLYVHSIATVVSLLIASTSTWPAITSFSSTFWLNLLYLSIVSTTFGTTVYFAASRKLGSKIASSFIFVVPLTALVSGIIFLKETPDIIVITGGALSLMAVYLINSSVEKKENIPET